MNQSFSLYAQFTDDEVSGSQMRKAWEYLEIAMKVSKKITLTQLHIHTATMLSEAGVSAFKLFFLEKRIFKYFLRVFSSSEQMSEVGQGTT